MSESTTAPKTKARGGRAFHSRIEPFVDFIREQRHRRKTWQQIATLLCTEKNCPITFQAVHQFYRRYIKRQARPHWEREAMTHPTAPLSTPSRKTVLASLPISRPFNTPNPDTLTLNDPTHL